MTAGAEAPATWHGPDGVPRRTSPLTVAVAGASMVFGVVALVIGSAIQDAITAAATDADPPRSPLGLLLPGLVLVVVGGVQVVRWATTTYSVLPTELVVDSGVLNREHRVFPFARIQQADTHQNLVGQLMGLTELKVDVAGAAGSNRLRLRLLDRVTAVALRDHILLRRAQLHEERAATEEGGPERTGEVPTRSGADLGAIGRIAIGAEVGAGEREVLRIGPARLAVAALTRSEIAIGLPVAFIAVITVAVLLPLGGSSRFTVPVIAVAAAAGAVLIVAATVLETVINSYGFVVSLAGADIHLRRGSIETRNLTVPRRRVQQITIADNPLRRLLGLVELHLHTAAVTGAEEATTFTVPVLDRDAVDDVVLALMGDPRWSVPPLEPRSSTARRRAIVRRTALVAAIVVLPAVALRPAGVVLLGLLPLGYLWGAAAHRRAGHGRSRQVVAFARGVLHHRTDLVPIGRVQSGRTTQTIFQRRLELATILLDVAGSSDAPELADLDLATAISLRRDVPRASAPAAPAG